LDCKIQSYTREEREEFALMVARYVLDHPDEKMGFGVYSSGMPVKTVHIDTGWKQRAWEDGKKWLAEAGKNS
jgi:hypothetical protein